MDRLIAQDLEAFDPIGLDGLNAKAAMLERLDNKYVVPEGGMRAALARFRDGFDVLEIDGRRAFRYDTRYFDDAGRRAYHDHHQGRRKRCKVRIRDYVDAGFSYLEVKLKDRRDVTVKKRLEVRSGLAELDARCLAFVDECHGALYGVPLNRDLAPVLAMSYERITLVAKEGGERMTIDTSLGFEAEGAEREVAPGLFIVETKSARGNGAADAVLRGLHLHPTPRMSKYCVGLAALGLVERANRFLPALRRLGVAPGHAAATPIRARQPAMAGALVAAA